MLCLRPPQLPDSENASNSMSSTTPSSSNAPNAVNGRVQLEVQRYVPEEFLPVWGVPFGRRGSYLTENGASEFGLISYANGEGIYQVEPPPGSSRPATPAPVPLLATTTANPEFHEQSLPQSAPNVSAAGAYHPHVSYNYVLTDPLHYTQPVTALPYLRNPLQGPSYFPGGPIPRVFDVHSTHLGSVLGGASPSANSWAGLPLAGHAYGGFTAPSNVDGHQSPHGSVLGGVSPAANSWANSPFTGHASLNGSFPASSPPYSYSSPVYNSASPGSWSGSSSSAPSQSVHEDFIDTTRGEYVEPRDTTSIRPSGGT
ncbi:hypothetical protein F5887DRAFT_1190464 [Amanita rubescens]|nr:hypothetical protein F5887DRAFT_1190464 [Amanita rubescens]